MTEERNIIYKISRFIDEFMEDCKTKPMRYGSIEEIEYSLHILDLIYFMIIEIDEFENDLHWYRFLSFKGYGPKSASMVIREKFPKVDHYEVLFKLREEYYLWRKKRIDKIKNRALSGLTEK